MSLHHYNKDQIRFAEKVTKCSQFKPTKPYRLPHVVRELPILYPLAFSCSSGIQPLSHTLTIDLTMVTNLSFKVGKEGEFLRLWRTIFAPQRGITDLEYYYRYHHLSPESPMWKSCEWGNASGKQKKILTFDLSCKVEWQEWYAHAF